MYVYQPQTKGKMKHTNVAKTKHQTERTADRSLSVMADTPVSSKESPSKMMSSVFIHIGKRYLPDLPPTPRLTRKHQSWH